MADDQSENSELRHRKVEERDSGGEPLSAKENVSTTAENSEGVSVIIQFFLVRFLYGGNDGSQLMLLFIDFSCTHKKHLRYFGENLSGQKIISMEIRVEKDSREFILLLFNNIRVLTVVLYTIINNNM